MDIIYKSAEFIEKEIFYWQNW